MEKLLTIKEMAAMLSMSWRGVQELTKRREIPVVRLGRSVRYRPEAVSKALEKLTVRSI
jgi:excisionase family DNA binding protein